eukprot:6181396-Pleurochrysis_carterae.AAC.2
MLHRCDKSYAKQLTGTTGKVTGKKVGCLQPSVCDKYARRDTQKKPDMPFEVVPIAGRYAEKP